MIASDFGFDSGEYEFLGEAVELSKDVEGICCEVGVRLGRGTAEIMESVRQFCPNKKVIAVDCYGSLPYIGREHIGAIRLDYDNPMKAKCMAQLWEYVIENPVNFDFIPLTDYAFFDKFSDGVPNYELEESLLTKYSMVHLDAQHTVADVSRQIIWFNERMLSGATLVIDDITIDFFDIIPVNLLLVDLGWVILKQGVKKGLYKKL